MTWSRSTLAKGSGAPIIKGTRVQADTIIENYEGGSDIEEIAENFAVSEATVRGLLAFADCKAGSLSSEVAV